MESILKVIIFSITLDLSYSNIDLSVPRAALETLPTMVEQHGYKAIQHQVTTEDGYILKMFQIKRPGTAVTRSLPVLVVHGIMGSCEDYLRMGPKNSLGYLLADEGYDVWLGNLRGNLYTSHVNLTKQDRSFWNFSFDEHGIYDLPSMAKAVINLTGAKQFQYIGYSMSTTSYFIMCDKRPEFREYFATVVAMAPVVSFDSVIKRLFGIIYRSRILDIAKRLRIVVFNNNLFLQRLAILSLCNPSDKYNDFCYTLTFLLIGTNYEEVQEDKIYEIFMKFQPMSLRQLEHYLQIATLEHFSAFDWGTRGNLIKYGTNNPPVYNLTKNTSPLALYFGKNDLLATHKSGLKLYRKLKKNKQLIMSKVLPHKNFNHLDYLYSKTYTRLVNKDVLKTMTALYNATKL